MKYLITFGFLILFTIAITSAEFPDNDMEVDSMDDNGIVDEPQPTPTDRRIRGRRGGIRRGGRNTSPKRTSPKKKTPKKTSSKKKSEKKPAQPKEASSGPSLPPVSVSPKIDANGVVEQVFDAVTGDKGTDNDPETEDPKEDAEEEETGSEDLEEESVMENNGVSDEPPQTDRRFRGLGRFLRRFFGKGGRFLGRGIKRILPKKISPTKTSPKQTSPKKPEQSKKSSPSEKPDVDVNEVVEQVSDAVTGDKGTDNDPETEDTEKDGKEEENRSEDLEKESVMEDNGVSDEPPQTDRRFRGLGRFLRRIFGKGGRFLGRGIKRILPKKISPTKTSPKQTSPKKPEQSKKSSPSEKPDVDVNEVVEQVSDAVTGDKGTDNDPETEDTEKDGKEEENRSEDIEEE